MLNIVLRKPTSSEITPEETNRSALTPIIPQGFPENAESLMILAFSRAKERMKNNLIDEEIRKQEEIWEENEKVNKEKRESEYQTQVAKWEETVAQIKAEHEAKLKEYEQAVAKTNPLVEKAKTNPQTFQEWYWHTFFKIETLNVTDASPIKMAYENIRTDLVFDPAKNGLELLNEIDSPLYNVILTVFTEQFPGFDFNRAYRSAAYKFVKDLLINGRSATLSDYINAVVESIHSSASYRGYQRDKATAWVKNFSRFDQELSKKIYGLFALHVAPTLLSGATFETQYRLQKSFLTKIPLPPVMPKLPPKPAGPVSTKKPDFRKLLEDQTDKKREAAMGFSIDKYPAVKEQMEVLLKIRAMQGRFNQAVEKAVFPDAPITKFMKYYNDAPLLFGSRHTKSKMRKIETGNLKTGAVETLEMLLEILTFINAVTVRTKKLKELDQSTHSKNEVKLLEEVAIIYCELAKSMALSLEIEFACGLEGNPLPNAGKIWEIRNRMGATGENAINILQDAIIQAKVAKEAGQI